MRKDNKIRDFSNPKFVLWFCEDFRYKHIHLIESPYQTDCFHYTELGCQSRQDKIYKYNIDLALKQRNSLSLFAKADINNDKDLYFYSNCINHYSYSVCL